MSDLQTSMPVSGRHGDGKEAVEQLEAIYPDDSVAKNAATATAIGPPELDITVTAKFKFKVVSSSSSWHRDCGTTASRHWQ